MQLKLKRRSDYTIRAMICIGRHPGPDLPQARQIAAQMEVPYKYLTHILANLVNKGFLTAKAGPLGGYLLARPADQITLWDLVEAADEYAGLAPSCVLADGPCDWETVCPVHDTWAHAQDAFTAALAAETLADVVATDAAIQAGTFQPEAPLHPKETTRHGTR